MNNLVIWSGSLVPLTVTQGDPTSVSVTLHLLLDDEAAFTYTANFETVDNQVVADLTFEAPTVGEETVYEYYITENLDEEPSLVYPDPNNCSDGNCELPTITVCVLEAETS